MISAQDVKKLRDSTGASMMQCKKALEESKGNFEEAVKIMQKNGSKIANKKCDRFTSEGMIGSYIHTNGKAGVLVEINCETDFVARGDEFKEFAHDIAMHILAMNPQFVSVDEIDKNLIEAKRAEVIEETKGQDKPADIMEKIIEGKVKKHFDDISLLTQPFVKNPDMTIGQLLTEKIAKFGENVKIKRFVKLEVE
ncbi:MAG: translation elongation factor Ts [Candidatus Pacebacteria bacterium]|nr:translation elongation factor Ts [Candidatus Paceibacterota bacterium]